MKKKISKKTIIITAIILLIIAVLVVASLFLLKNNQENTPRTVTVTFISENNEMLKTAEIEKGSLLEQWDPENTENFIGWFTENGLPFDFTSKVKNDMTLYAKYSSPEDDIVYITMTFLVDGEFFESLGVPENDTAPEPEAPVKEGYTFVGWYENDTLFDFSKPITEEHTLNAVFTPNN